MVFEITLSVYLPYRGIRRAISTTQSAPWLLPPIKTVRGTTRLVKRRCIPTFPGLTTRRWAILHFITAMPLGILRSALPRLGATLVELATLLLGQSRFTAILLATKTRPAVAMRRIATLVSATRLTATEHFRIARPVNKTRPSATVHLDSI